MCGDDLRCRGCRQRLAGGRALFGNPAITLDELHEVLQVAIGWTDSHLHQFRTDDAIYTVPLDDWVEDDEVDERGVRLSGLPTRFVYAYDLGDGWQHDVEVLGARWPTWHARLAQFLMQDPLHALRGQLQEVRWLIRSLEIRNETLLKVARTIV